jgi:hypothetical protein
MATIIARVMSWIRFMGVAPFSVRCLYVMHYTGWSGGQKKPIAGRLLISSDLIIVVVALPFYGSSS